MHDIPTQIYREIWDMRWTLVLLAVTVMFISSLAYAEVRKVYYESGRLQAEENYKGDKLEGTTKTYYGNGQLEGEANFKNGVIISEKKYNEDGKLKFDQDYPTE